MSTSGCEEGSIINKDGLHDSMLSTALDPEFSARSHQALASTSQKLHDLKKNMKKRGHVSSGYGFSGEHRHLSPHNLILDTVLAEGIATLALTI